ncbi:MAG: hypothetical protein JWO56_3711, partial [Acidobacteria bacterium]|nr:hypothetical protein [Acidobacteriota bacterium]
AVPATPSSPSPGSTSSPGPIQGSTSVFLSWGPSSGTLYYSLGVRNMTTNVLVVDTTTANAFYNTSLSGGTPYRWNVAACNNSGCSSFTTVLYFQTPTTASIPGAPQNLSAAPGNGQNGLAWNPPSSNGGASITSYRVFRGTSSANTQIVTSGGCASLGASTSCVDTGLTNGQSYYYIVSAVNAAGQGPPSNSATATPAAPVTIPATPTNPTPGSPGGPGPIQGGTNVTLSWGGSAGTLYYSLGVRNMNTNVLVVDTTTANTSYTAALSAQTPYRWNVAACNNAGCSSFTSVLYFQTPTTASIPGPPQNLAAAPGNGQNGLAWNPPSSDGGATITSYRVFRGTSSANTQIVTSGGCANLGAATGCTDTGLTNGQSYYYIVSAVNAVGQGPPSNSATATPAGGVTIPAIPTNPTPGSPAGPGPILGSTSVTLSWGGSVGTAYYSLGVRNMNTNALVVDTTTANTSYTAALSAQTPYRWNVAACNNAGCSSFTGVLYFQTPSTAVIPGAPQNLAAAPGNGQNGLAWNPPSSDGGATITSYRVFRGTSSANTQLVTSGGCANLGVATGCTDTGLTNGQSYYYIVSAVNSAGQGPPSNSATATPIGGVMIPATPANPAPGSTGGPGPIQSSSSVRLSWGGSVGAAYYSVAVRNMNTNALVIDTTTVNTSYNASLTGGTPFRWNVAACNNSGCSSFTSVLYFQTSTGVTIPAAPQSLSASAGNGQNRLSWSPPASDGGATITSYRVFRGTNSGNTLIVTSGGCANLGPVTSCTDTGLTNGQSYYYIVSAVNSAGQGPPSNSATATPAGGIPIPATPANPSPGSTSAPGPALGGTSVLLSWSPSIGTAYYSVAVRNMNTSALVVDTTTANTSYTAALSAQTPYRWNVNACNNAGCSSFTAVLYFQTMSPGAAIPGPPQNLSAFPGNGQIGLSWSPPASDGGASITSYRLFRGTSSANTLIVTGGGCAGLGAVTSCTDTGLANGQSYYYIVSAVNSAGQGPASNCATATPAGNSGSGRPDLVPAFVNLDRTAVQAGSQLTVTCGVENRGTATAPVSVTRLYLTRGGNPGAGDPSLTDVATPQLAPRSSTTLTANVRLAAGLAVGTYYVVAQVDASRAIDQSDTTNDVALSGALTISQTATCDLTCAGIVPASAPVNHAVAFAATLSGAAACGSPSVIWDFGDTNLGTGETASHTYSRPGTYAWSMHATAGSQQCSKSGSIQISAPANTTLTGTVVSLRTGAPIRDAQITVGWATESSDAAGAYRITSLPPDEYTAHVVATGYAPMTQTIILPGGVATVRKDFQLEPLPPALGPITIHPIQSKYRAGTFFLDGQRMVVPFQAGVEWSGRKPDTVSMTATRRGLTQIQATAAGATGTFDVGSDFGPCGVLTVGARSADGALAKPVTAPFTVMSKPFAGLPLQTTFVDRGDSFAYESLQGLNFDFIDDTPLPIDNDVPLIGSKGLSLRYLPTVSASIESDGSVQISSNFDNLPNSSRDKALFEKSAVALGGVSFAVEPRIDIDGHYRPSDCRWHYGGSGGINGAVHFKIVYYLPVTFPVYLSGQADFTAGGSVHFAGLQPDSGELHLEIEGRGAIGAGVSGFLSAEGFGKVNGLFTLTTAVPHKTMDLTFSAGVAVQFLFFTKEYTLLETRRHWPKENPASLRASWIESPERLMSRDYLTRPAYARFQPLAAAEPRNDGIAVEALQSNVFPQSTPSLAVHPADRVLAWVADLPSRSSANRTVINTSRYADGRWSDPALADDDGTADFHPIVTAAGAGALMAWENEHRVLPDNTTSDAALQNLEIAVAELPAGESAWRNVRHLTSNGYLDRSPQVSGDSVDDAMLTWIANPSSDPSGSVARPNELWFARKTAGGWSAPQLVAQLPYAVLRHTMLHTAGHATVVLSVDEDNDIMTVDDRELVALTYDGAQWSTPRRLTFNGIVDDSPTLVRTAGGPVLFWLQGGEISQCPGLDVTSRSVVYASEYSSNLAAFQVGSDSHGSLAIVWAEPGAHPSDLQVLRYDAARHLWGLPQPLTNDVETEKYLAVALSDDGQLIAVYDRGVVGPPAAAA